MSGKLIYTSDYAKASLTNRLIASSLGWLEQAGYFILDGDREAKEVFKETIRGVANSSVGVRDAVQPQPDGAQPAGLGAEDAQPLGDSAGSG